MKLLVIRLSSLGDVLLATAFLENVPAEVQVDWVVSSEFAFLLKDHPKIHRLYSFDRQKGLRGWWELLRDLSKNRYDGLVDLHRTLRSAFARFYFRVFSFRTKFYQLSKQRIRTLGVLLLKGAWPRQWLPTPYWKRFANLGMSMVAPQGTTPELNPPQFHIQGDADIEAELLKRYTLTPKNYVALMPASRWKSKQWSPERYLELCQALLRQFPSLKILMMGRSSDAISVELLQRLSDQGSRVVSALDEPSFHHTAMLLKNAMLYVGSDTGLMHLSESVGTRAVTIFGPTRPSLGFGPRNPESVSVSSNVFCSPCSKSGQHCYRFWDPYACLKRVSVEQVIREIR